MWTTADRYVLHLPSNQAAHVLRRIAELCPELGDQAAEELGRLVRRSRRAGTARHRRTNRRYPFFSGRLGRVPVRLIVRRLRWPHAALFDVARGGYSGGGAAAEPAYGPEPYVIEEPPEPAPIEQEPASDDPAQVVVEEIARPGFQVRMRWYGPYRKLDDVPAALRPRPGIYIILAGSKPIYVGKTLEYGRRLEEHIASGRWKPGRGQRVWLGTVSPRPLPILETVEHALIRLLNRAGLELDNKSSTTRLDVRGKRTLTIENLVPTDLRSDKVTAAAQPNARMDAPGTLVVKPGGSLELE